MGSRTKPKKPKKDKGKKDGKKAKGRQADRADKYVLYQRSVQEPDADLDFMVEVFEEHYARTPRTLREDFCAAANTACHWVKRHRENQAWGIDLDPEPLAWGRAHNARQLSEEQRSRLHLIEGDVLEAREPKVELIAAQNFSYCIFKTREQLRRYFEVCRASLQEEGMLVLDLFGGPEAQTAQEEETEYDDFSYVWDQDRYDPITNEILCHIHFRFPDGSEIERAFSYDWRLWTIAEVRELLTEAGFSETGAYWEGADEDGEGTGEYTREESVDNEEAWVAYVVGFA